MLLLWKSRALMAVAAAVLFAMSTAADAATLRFAATSASYGELGWFSMNDSIFDGSSSQWVLNANVLDLWFRDPITRTSFDIDDVVPTDRTIFDSTGTPTVVGGIGSLAQHVGRVSFVGTSFVRVGNYGFGDVTWSTTPVSPVPLPPAVLLFAAGLAGLGGMSWLRRRRLALEICAA